MSNFVCAICTSKSRHNLINIDTGQIRELYNNICDVKTQLINTLPSHICKLCVSHLIKFYNFQSQCQISLQTSEQVHLLTQQNPENNYVIDRSDVNIHSVFSLPEPNTMNYIEVNHELYKGSKSQNKKNYQAKSIYSFHLDIPNNKPINNGDTNKQIEITLPRYHSNPNELNSGLTESSINNSGPKLPNENIFLLKMNIDNNGTNESTLDSLMKYMPNAKPIKSLEKFMNIKLLSVQEASAAHELLQSMMQRNVKQEDTNNICNICNCYVEKDLEKHYKDHETHTEFACNICSKSYAFSKVLEHHFMTSHMFKYICRMCCEVVFTLSDAHSHMRNIHKKTKHELGMENEERRKAYSHLETHFKRELVTPEQAYEYQCTTKFAKSAANRICNLCMKIFPNTDMLQMHHDKYHTLSPGKVQCYICKYTFKTKGKLLSHIKFLHTWRYSCKFCLKNACSHKINHLKKGDTTPNECEFCGKIFNKPTSLYSHRRYAHPCNAVCNICGETYSQYSGVRMHQSKTHTDQERKLGQMADVNKDESSSLYCKDCDAQFINQDGFDRHLRSSGKHSTYNGGYRDSMRGYMVNKREIYKKTQQEKERQDRINRKLEKGIKNNKIDSNQIKSAIKKCHICGVEFDTLKNALGHYKDYHPEDLIYLAILKKIHRCDECDYASISLSNLYIHKRMHTSERPYKCTECQKAYKCKLSLKRHIEADHSDEPMRFQCNYCSKLFRQKIQAKMHMMRIHSRARTDNPIELVHSTVRKGQMGRPVTIGSEGKKRKKNKENDNVAVILDTTEQKNREDATLEEVEDGNIEIQVGSFATTNAMYVNLS